MRRTPARIHIAGGSGTGKTTLARQLGAMLDAPVHHLDEVAREVDTGRVRDVHERQEIVSQIAASPRWVTEGIHVGWTDELCRQADVIVWLDQLGWSRATLRVVRRFVAAGISEMRRERGWRRINRVRSYGRHLAELYRASREIRAFEVKDLDAETGDAGSRAATAAQLMPYAAKVVTCRSQGDIEVFIAGLDRSVLDQPAVGS